MSNSIENFKIITRESSTEVKAVLASEVHADMFLKMLGVSDDFKCLSADYQKDYAALLISRNGGSIYDNNPDLRAEVHIALKDDFPVNIEGFTLTREGFYAAFGKYVGK